MIHHIENHIQRMRQRPHHVKKQYAFLVSLAITLVIFGFWMASFGFGVQTVSSTQGVKAPSPVSSMTADASDALIYLKELFFGANKTTYSSDNVVVTGGK